MGVICEGGQIIKSALLPLKVLTEATGGTLPVCVDAAKSPGELLFRERVGDVWLASPIQVYLDLLGGEGRAKEMAEHLQRDRIGF